MASDFLLRAEDLATGYSKKQVLFGISLKVNAGEMVAIIGPNGSGKSTTLKALCGLLPIWKGSVHFGGANIDGLSPAQNVAKGLVFSPQGNRVFPELSVMENLEIGGFRLPRKELTDRIEEMLAFFPILKARVRQEAGKLSGGERQIVALARALIPRPRLLMLDEPSLGLFSGLINNVFNLISRVNKETGTAILIVEQKVRDVLAISQRVYAIKLGKVAFEDSPTALMNDPLLLKNIFL